MDSIEQVLAKYNKPLFILLFALCLFPFISPAVACFWDWLGDDGRTAFP